MAVFNFFHNFFSQFSVKSSTRDLFSVAVEELFSFVVFCLFLKQLLSFFISQSIKQFHFLCFLIYFNDITNSKIVISFRSTSQIDVRGINKMMN